MDSARSVVTGLGMLPSQNMPCAAETLHLSVKKTVAAPGIESLLVIRLMAL